MQTSSYIVAVSFISSAPVMQTSVQQPHPTHASSLIVTVIVVSPLSWTFLKRRVAGILLLKSRFESGDETAGM
jgi:hypothetical protein